MYSTEFYRQYVIRMMSLHTVCQQTSRTVHINPQIKNKTLEGLQKPDLMNKPVAFPLDQGHQSLHTHTHSNNNNKNPRENIFFIWVN